MAVLTDYLKTIDTDSIEGAAGETLTSILDNIDSGALTFTETVDAYKISISLSDFDLLTFDDILYDKLNLPFQISIYNNTFMKTTASRLVSRKLPNTISQASNFSNPFEIEIGETKSFMLQITIDTLDDLNQLIYNDVAFVIYSDNTTLEEIDFAIRVPDIRGITSVKNIVDNTFDLDDWYEQGLIEFSDLILKSLKLNDSATYYYYLKNYLNYRTLYDTSDSTIGQSLLNSLFDEIQTENKLSSISTNKLGLPSDLIQNLINLNSNKTFRDKFKFNIYRIQYYTGIIDSSLAIGYDAAEDYFTTWRNGQASNFIYNLSHTDVSTQKTKLDMLAIEFRVPFFGSTQMNLDCLFYVTNIKSVNNVIFQNNDIDAFVGDYIRVSAIVDDTPLLNNITIQYDISSQVKENMTTYIKPYAKNYVKNVTDNTITGYKIVNITKHIDFSSLISENDITLSYSHSTPLEIDNNNWIVFEHSESFRNKLLTYDQTSYFGINATDNFPDTSIKFYHCDVSIEKQLYNETDETQFKDSTTWIVDTTVYFSLSNEISYSFKILSIDTVDKGESTILLTSSSNDVNMQVVDRITIFNDGNTFLNITDLNIFYPNAKYSHYEQLESKYSSYYLNHTVIPSDSDFYSSLFASTSPISISSFDTLTPGETGYIYIVYQINRSLIDVLFSTFTKVPIYIRIEFNDSLSAYLCHFDQKTLDTFKDYAQQGEENISYQYPFSDALSDTRPTDIQSSYSWGLYELDNNIQKSKFQYDIAALIDATVRANNNDITDQMNMSNYGVCDSGILRTGYLTPFSHSIILPVPSGTSKFTTITDLINLCKVSAIKDIDYKAYIMRFDTFFINYLSDIKHDYKLVSLSVMGDYQTSKTLYMRKDISCEYGQYNYEEYDTTMNHNQVSFDQIENVKVYVEFLLPETQSNSFEVSFPKALDQDVESATSLISMYLDTVNNDASYSYDDINKVTTSTTLVKTSYNQKFISCVDMGEIVGNKQITMMIDTDYLNLFKIKSYDNFTINSMSIGPDTADTFTMKIINPELTYANVIFEFFGNDYTCDFTQICAAEDSILANAGNYLIEPAYIDLEYIPIDETYSAMIQITNQNAYEVDFTILDRDTETKNAIQLIQFSENDAAEVLHYYFDIVKKVYTMKAGETVKLYINIIPRRIGSNFYTLQLKLGNSIRTLNIEFKSFVNNKAYFVLDSNSKTIDFGEVPIGKISEDAIIIKNIGKVLGKVNSIYTFGNDSQNFKILDPNTGSESQRLSFNKVVKAKTSLSIPVRYYSKSYGFNYSYCYIETNEPVLEDGVCYDADNDITTVYVNSPKYLTSLLKATSIIEDEVVDMDSYIFLGYVNPTSSRYRSYEVQINSKSKNNLVTIFKVTNMMSNYLKIKFSKNTFDTSTSVQLTLNPRAYTEGQYYDEIHMWMIVYSKKTGQRKIVLNKIPISQYVTKEQKLEFDVNASEIIFVAKPYMKNYKYLNISNYSTDDATLFTNVQNDYSGLFTLMPDINNTTVVIPEGVTYKIMLLFGGDQRFIGKYDTMLTLLMTLGDESIIKYIPLMGLIGDENVIKFYKRKQIIVS